MANVFEKNYNSYGTSVHTADINFDDEVADLLNDLKMFGTEIEVLVDDEISAFIDDTLIPTLKNNSPASDKENGQGKSKQYKSYSHGIGTKKEGKRIYGGGGKYRDGWTKKARTSGFTYSKYYSVSNRNRPDLTWMLEYGFERQYSKVEMTLARSVAGRLVRRNRRVTYKTYTATPRPHIRPAVEQTEPILINRLKQKLEQKIGGF